MAGDAEWLKEHIRDVLDFPEPGIVFKDITPLLADPKAFRFVLDRFAEQFAGENLDKIVGIESRGFVFGAPVADRLELPFVPVRKPGKLPHEVEQQEYALEYGTDLIEIHRDALEKGDRVAVIDDLIATGGTAGATARLVERLGAEVVGFAFLIELAFLPGREKLGEHPMTALIAYD